MGKMFFEVTTRDGIYVVTEKETGEEICTIQTIQLTMKVVKALEASVRLTEIKMLGF